MATVEVSCRFCRQTESVRTHGTSRIGYRRYRCTECRKTFQLEYTYEVHKPGIKNKIVDMALNGSGVRDTVRVLKVGINTVLRTLKNSPQNR